MQPEATLSFHSTTLFLSILGKEFETLKKAVLTTIVILTLVLLLTTALTSFSRNNFAGETYVPVLPAGQATPAEPDAVPETVAEPGRQPGERFETVIILEGMEETVRYEHIRNDMIGFEMDYDYESFVRRSEADRECFISIYDNSATPENYLEVTYSSQDAETVAASIGEALSNEYEISRSTYLLDRAGSCIRIDASEVKGGGRMLDLLQMVYIIPASDGCRIATAHYSIESAEGFGRRFSYLMHTFSVIPYSSVSSGQ